MRLEMHKEQVSLGHGTIDTLTLCFFAPVCPRETSCKFQLYIDYIDYIFISNIQKWTPMELLKIERSDPHKSD